MAALSDARPRTLFLNMRVCSYLDSVFRVSGFVDTSFTHGEGAHADVFLQYVAIAEQQVLPV